MWQQRLVFLVVLQVVLVAQCQTQNCFQDSCATDTDTDSQTPETGEEETDFEKYRNVDALPGPVDVQDAGGASIRFTLTADGKLKPPMPVENFGNIKPTKIRPDDVIVCGYVKTGCHWIWEIASMILQGKAHHSKKGKTAAMLEWASPEEIEGLPSPRLLNTHVEYDDLPHEALTGRTKLIITVRNPKDTAVSLYNHQIRLPQLYRYNGKFSDWFPIFLDGKADYGSYLDYHLSWEKAIQENPDHPILVCRYEDFKEDVHSEIRRLAKFLGVTLTDDVVNGIAKATNLDTLKKQFDKNSLSFALLRKGQVGDWKNWLTVAQSELIDEKWADQLEKTRFKTRYELP